MIEYKYPIPPKNSSGFIKTVEAQRANAPFFSIFAEKSNWFSKPIRLDLLLSAYQKKYSASRKEAKSVFYLEQSNYTFKKMKSGVVVNADYWITKGKYEDYKVLDPKDSSLFCVAQTRMGLRCMARKKIGDKCSMHSPETKMKPSVKKTNSNFLLEENDIEKLRSVCLVVYENYHHLWSDIITLATKKRDNLLILEKVNNLELEINKLKEKLK